MSNLNTSNITVPSVATMVEHLTDKDPHPQYLNKHDASNYIKNHVTLADLQDVILASALASNAMLMFNGFNWTNIDPSELVSVITKDATTTEKGVVQLTNNENVIDPSNSTMAVTPSALSAWAASKSIVTSDNFYSILSRIMVDPEIELPINLEKLTNVEIISPVQNQYLGITSYDPLTGKVTWGNLTINMAKANTTTQGIVRIASPDEVRNGTSSSWAEMEASGHVVPSVGALAALVGSADRFVSRITVESNISEVYDHISGAGSAGEGITGAGYTTVVNRLGYVDAHIVNGGTLSAVAGSVFGLTVSSGTVTVEKDATVTDLSMVGSGIITVNQGSLFNAKITAQTTSGTVVATNNAEIHAIATVGVLSATSGAVIEHAVINTNGSMIVVSTASAYHTTVKSGATVTIGSNGYAEDITVVSGGNLIVTNAGMVNGCTLLAGATITVSSGASVIGLARYGANAANINQNATVEMIDTGTSDILIFSNASGSNIGNEILAFSAANHPVGVRREQIDSITGTITHTFYPVAVSTRIPNASDSMYNDYTMNVSGMGIQEAIDSQIANEHWYITF